MPNLIKYLTHRLTATNQHGVHSPFVYDYVTKCLYSKQEYSKNKSVNVLLKSIAYFKAKHIRLLSDRQTLKNKVVQKFPEIRFDKTPIDLSFINASQPNGIQKSVAEIDTLHDDSVLLIDDIYSTKDSLHYWEQLKSDAIVTVTLDLFYCGVVFFRTEQAKEHFKIRI